MLGCGPGPETAEDKNTIEKGQGRGSVPTGMNASLSESPRERGLRQGRKCRRSTDTDSGGLPGECGPAPPPEISLCLWAPSCLRSPSSPFTFTVRHDIHGETETSFFPRAAIAQSAFLKAASPRRSGRNTAGSVDS